MLNIKYFQLKLNILLFYYNLCMYISRLMALNIMNMTLLRSQKFLEIKYKNIFSDVRVLLRITSFAISPYSVQRIRIF